LEADINSYRVLYLNSLIYTDGCDEHKFHCLILEVIFPVHFRMNVGEKTYKSAHFLTLVVDEGEWLFSGPLQFTLGESPLLGTPSASVGILEKRSPFFLGKSITVFQKVGSYSSQYTE
jgi:hypothetical protein